jgi:hypothetical protein
VNAEAEFDPDTLEGPDGFFYDVTGAVAPGSFGPVRQVARRVVQGAFETDPTAIVYQYQVGGQCDEWYFFEWQLEALNEQG